MNQRHGKFYSPKVAGICFGLAAIIFMVFGQTLHHDFIDYDDGEYVYENPEVTHGLTPSGIAWAFTHFHSANWHPLTWISHQLDCQLYGLHPAGHHLTNVLLHIAMAIALFLVLRQMTGAMWRSAFVAAVFAIHPLRVESVAWVAERKDVLSGFLFVLTIAAYARYARLPRSLARYALVLLLFSLGLMCKPMLVTLPFVLLLLDFWPLQRKLPVNKLVIEKIPLLILSITSAAITLLAQRGAIQSTEHFSPQLRIGNALVSCVVYLGQMFYPARLALYYPYPHQGLSPLEIIFAVILLAGISAVAFWQRRKQPWLTVGWTWYLLMLLPVLGLVQVGFQPHADRYTYLPQIGIYVALTWLAARWITARWVATGFGVIVLAALMACAWKQTSYWQNGETIWAHTLTCTTDNDLAHKNLGNALFHEGKIDEAITQYHEALQIKPDYSEAHNNLGIALFQKGDADGAIAEYKNALQINPTFAEAHLNLGLALFRGGHVDEAMAEFQAALRLKPDYADAHYNLGTADLQKGQLDNAISEYKSALQINPDYTEAHANLGNIFAQQGKMDDALAHFQKALQLAPNNSNIQNSLAWLLSTSSKASLRDGQKAVALATQANAASGGSNPLILHTLAAADAEAGKFSDAKTNIQKAIDLAQAANRADLVARFKAELERYEAGRPLHD